MASARRDLAAHVESFELVGQRLDAQAVTQRFGTQRCVAPVGGSIVEIELQLVGEVVLEEVCGDFEHVVDDGLVDLMTGDTKEAAR